MAYPHLHTPAAAAPTAGMYGWLLSSANKRYEAENSSSGCSSCASSDTCGAASPSWPLTPPHARDTRVGLPRVTSPRYGDTCGVTPQLVSRGELGKSSGPGDAGANPPQSYVTRGESSQSRVTPATPHFNTTRAPSSISDQPAAYSQSLHTRVAPRQTTDARVTPPQPSDTRVTSLPRRPSATCTGVWMRDIRLHTEDECMNMLQGKSLTEDTATDTPLVMSQRHNDTVSDRIVFIQTRAHHIRLEFRKLFKKLEHRKWRHVRSAVYRIACHIRSFVNELSPLQLTASPAAADRQPNRGIRQQESVVMKRCLLVVEQLDELESMSSAEQHLPAAPESEEPLPAASILVHKTLLTNLSTLAAQFGDMIDGALTVQIQQLLVTMSSSSNPHALKTCINHIIDLALDSDSMCDIIVKEGAVRVLVSLCTRDDLSYIRLMSLRALACISSAPDTAALLQECSGVHCLLQLLDSPESSTEVRSEVASVFAQLTSCATGSLPHLPGIVAALTRLCAECSSHDVFLLATAALANMTSPLAGSGSSADTAVCNQQQQHIGPALRHASTIAVLYNCWKWQNGKTDSLFVRDQVSRVLSHAVSAGPGAVSRADEERCVDMLVAFLRRSDVTAATTTDTCDERVLRKCANTLTTLAARGKGNVHRIVTAGGIPRLAQLCRDGDSRNHSEAVLAACLAALRQISTESCSTGAHTVAAVDALRVGNSPEILPHKLTRVGGMDCRVDEGVIL